jgi:hypothetical protein
LVCVSFAYKLSGYIRRRREGEKEKRLFKKAGFNRLVDGREKRGAIHRLGVRAAVHNDVTHLFRKGGT